MLKIYLSQENFYKKKKCLEGKKYVFTNYAGNTKRIEVLLLCFYQYLLLNQIFRKNAKQNAI